MAKEQTFEHPPRGHVALLAYDSANDRWQVVHVNVDGELQVYLAGHAGTVLVQQYMPSLLQPGINTYDGSAWHKQAPIWGYTDSLWGAKDAVSDVAATFYLVGDEVPPGEVWVVNKISWFRSVNAGNIMRLSVYTGGAYVNLVDYPVVAVNTFYEDDMRGVLKEGERLRFGFAGATIGETCEAHYWGYKMSIDM